MKTIKHFSWPILFLLFFFVSCEDDLDTLPVDEDVTTNLDAYSSPESIRQVLANLYSSLVLTGQEGPNGNPDIISNDEGETAYMRLLWKLQELTTDEAVVAWGDGAIQTLNTNNWDTQNTFIEFFYTRIFYQITLANDIIRNISGSSDPVVQEYTAEARFLRAFSYFHALDMFGNVPFVDESNAVGSAPPQQITREDLFAWLETELLELAPLMKEPGTQEYGRVDRAAAWTLLARLYLNASTYTGQDRSVDCLTYAGNVINSGAYSLSSDYTDIFKADNHLSPEIIMTGVCDVDFAQSWGGTTFLINATRGGSMSPTDYGGVSAWGGIRANPELVDLFDPNDSTDVRGNLFYTDGQTKDIPVLTEFTNGYASFKWNNLTSAGDTINNGSSQSSIDFPFMRLGEVYLMFAEAAVRSGQERALAVQYVNELRERASGGSNANNIDDGDLDLPFILDERGRELYWEGYRRTDLIRFGVYTGGTYNWSWKGGTQSGTSIGDFRDLFPIPLTEMQANPNLEQTYSEYSN